MKHYALIIALLALFVGISACGKKEQVPEPTATGNYDPALAEQGKALFDVACASCHGPTGQGDGPAGVALNPKPRNIATDEFKFGGNLAAIQSTISEGAAVKGGSPSMIGYKTVYQPEQIEALAHYVLKLHGGQ